jgi:hypothetical protein
MIDRWSLAKSKEEDLKYVSENDYVKIRIWFCNRKGKIKTCTPLSCINQPFLISNSKAGQTISTKTAGCSYSFCIF